MNNLYNRLFLTTFFSISCLVGSLCYAEHSHAPKGTWEPLNNQPTFSKLITNPILLTDGGVMVQNLSSDGITAIGEIWKLSPDINGRYVNGTWSQLASLPSGYIPLYHASAVLKDGRVIFAGGEYNGPDLDFAETNGVAIYDPYDNTWTTVEPPNFFDVNRHITGLFNNLGEPIPNPNPIGDAASVVLFDGTFMLSDAVSNKAALLDLKTLTWTPTGHNKIGNYHEEGWTLLPSGKVLTIDCYVGAKYPDVPTQSEAYNPKTGKWHQAGSTIAPLSGIASPAFTYPDREIGPAILRADGTVFALGALGNSSIYNTRNGKWKLGPTLPVINSINPYTSLPEGQLGAYDGPAALLPNGNVLLAVSPVEPNYFPPLHIFEFDGKKFIKQPTIPNALLDGAYACNMLVLPSGQVLMTDESGDVEIYTPGDTSYKDSWAPKITHAPKEVSAGGIYKIKGIRFNGMSQGSAYGDDYQSATNYPIVRITNLGTGHVFYARTHDHSSMAVASKKVGYTYFDVPYGIEFGESQLEVVANGIPSKPVIVIVN